MGIDILFPIVRAPSLSLRSPSLSSLPPTSPYPPLPLLLVPPSRRYHFFFGWRSAFFSIIILFRIQSIISISIVLRYFHLASHSERDETTRGVVVPVAPPHLIPNLSFSLSSLFFTLPLSVCSPHDATSIRHVRVPPRRPPCSPMCVRRWYNDGVASDDSLMRLNINSHFVDASPPLFRDFFPSRDSRPRLPDEHRG